MNFVYSLHRTTQDTQTTRKQLAVLQIHNKTCSRGDSRWAQDARWRKITISQGKHIQEDRLQRVAIYSYCLQKDSSNILQTSAHSHTPWPFCPYWSGPSRKQPQWPNADPLRAGTEQTGVPTPGRQVQTATKPQESQARQGPSAAGKWRSRPVQLPGAFTFVTRGLGTAGPKSPKAEAPWISGLSSPLPRGGNRERQGTRNFSPR